MNIFDMFSSAGNAPTPAEAPAPSGGQAPTPEQATTAAQSGVPAAFQGTAAESPEQKSPLDDFTAIFNIDPKTQGEDPEAALTSPLFNYDATKMQEAASKMNFAQGIDQELAQKAMGGDAAAFMQVLNAVGQNAFVQSAQLNSSVTEQGINTRLAAFDKVLPTRISAANTNELLNNDPTLNHAAVQPLMKAMLEQTTKAYPNASTAERLDMVKQYMSQVAQTLTPPPQATPQSGQQEQNFAEFFADSAQSF